MPEGVFFSLDGLDGTGKTTQAKLLVDWLRELGLKVTACTDPGGTDIGNKLRDMLLTGKERKMSLRTEALLFMASRAELVDRVIRPALEKEEIVVTDRFLLANVVYQGHGGGIDPADLWSVGEFATAGLEPDLTMVFDVPIDQAVKRRGKTADRMEKRDPEFAERVRNGYLTEARKRSKKHTIVYANPPIPVVHSTVKALVGSILRDRGYELPEE